MQGNLYVLSSPKGTYILSICKETTEISDPFCPSFIYFSSWEEELLYLTANIERGRAPMMVSDETTELRKEYGPALFFILYIYACALYKWLSTGQVKHWLLEGMALNTGTHEYYQMDSACVYVCGCVCVCVTIINEENEKLRGSWGTWEGLVGTRRSGNNAKSTLMYEILKIKKKILKI